MPTTQELRDKIRIADYELTRSHLWIAYDFEGNQRTIDLVPEKAAKLLTESGLIVGYLNYAGELAIQIDYEEEGTEQKLIAIEYDEFVLCFIMSQFKALACAVQHEKNNSEKKLISNVRQIPGMLASICGDYAKAKL